MSLAFLACVERGRLESQAVLLCNSIRRNAGRFADAAIHTFQPRQGTTITDAAKAAGVAHFIYSSVASANRATGIAHFDGKYAVEKHLQASGVPYTVVAPVFFMENLLQPWTLPSLRQGKLAMALPATRSLQQITVADIGAFVAAVIERGDTVFGRRFDIAGG